LAKTNKEPLKFSFPDACNYPTLSLLLLFKINLELFCFDPLHPKLNSTLIFCVFCLSTLTFLINISFNTVLAGGRFIRSRVVDVESTSVWSKKKTFKLPLNSYMVKCYPNFITQSKCLRPKVVVVEKRWSRISSNEQNLTFVHEVVVHCAGQSTTLQNCCVIGGGWGQRPSLTLSQFHQHFTSSFCADIFAPKNYKAKL